LVAQDSIDHRVRIAELGFADRFFRRRKPGFEPEAAVPGGSIQPTRALPRFLTGLGSRPQAMLIDLGPVVGPNVTFFGEELGCKIFVEDLSKDIDRHARDGTLDELPPFLAQRFPQPSESVDGILCWDMFDYLPRQATQALARQLVRILRPDGVLLAFFATAQAQAGTRPLYTKHVVVDRTHLEYRPYPAACGRQRPLQNRDIQRLFEPLRITDQFLLKTNMRELLFRKPKAGESPAEDVATA
jgi:SAM-dependent methyltransferase